MTLGGITLRGGTTMPPTGALDIQGFLLTHGSCLPLHHPLLMSPGWNLLAGGLLCHLHVTPPRPGGLGGVGRPGRQPRARQSLSQLTARLSACSWTPEPLQQGLAELLGSGW